jgi:hypothetical protein
MNHRTSCFALLAALLQLASANAEVISAFQLTHRFDRQTGREATDDIHLQKTDAGDSGSVVYVYYQNNSSAPVSIKDITDEGAGFAEKNSEKHAWEWVWLTVRPESIAPGEIGELAFASRRTIPQNKTLELSVEGAASEKFTLKQAPDARFATISFSHDLRRAYCFLVPEGDTATKLKDLKCSEAATFSWRNPIFEHGTRIGVFDFNKPVVTGKRIFFFAANDAGELVTGASLRAFSDLAVSGTYGFGQVPRYAANGLGGFNSFSPVPKSLLDEAAKHGVKVVTGKPDVYPATAGHSALYAYLLQDEPDCHDYNRTERPHNARIGAMAGEMIARYNKVAAADAVKPALLTLDLTYTPHNYFTYGPLPDIANPDIYTNTHGWSVKFIDNHLSMVKRSVGPRPFATTYQSGWEEWSHVKDGWVGKADILANGYGHYVDKERKPRGFGRPVAPEEISLAAHYALGNGATALFAYNDSTEVSGGILYHGTDVLPENWRTVGNISRKMRRIAGLLLPAHPLDWARTEDSHVWIKTLVSTEDAILVVAVNENYSYPERKFNISPKQATITLAASSWFNPDCVFKVEPTGFSRIPVRPGATGGIQWNDSVSTGEIYLIGRSESDAQARINSAEARERTAPQAVDDNKPESQK